MGHSKAAVEALGATWRTVIVRIRFTPNEKSRLELVAREMGLSLSGYLRQLALGRPLPARRPIRPIPNVNQQVYFELSRVAASLDQLAQKMDRAQLADRQQVLPVLELLAGAIADLRQNVIGVTTEVMPDEGRT
jgi:hypothetical protein